VVLPVPCTHLSTSDQDALFFSPFSTTLTFPQMIPLTRYTLLSVDDIYLKNTSYCLRPSSDAGVKHSFKKYIAKFGILQPPLLQRQKKHYIVLSGRKRIEAASSLGFKKIPCLIIKQDVDLLEFYETILVHAQIGSKLSSIEQAIFFAKVGDTLPTQQILSLLPLLGIKPQVYKLQEFTALLQLDQTAIEALHTGILQPKAAGKLAKLHPADQQEVVRLIEFFMLGGSKQQKLVMYALELVMRTNQPFTSFVGQWQKKGTEYDNRPQQAAALLNKLEKECFPNINEAETKFQQLQRSVHLPDNIRLQHTSSFEDDTLTLSILFQDQDSFLQGWERMKTSL
jgi:ParB family chromosome partitioning protein